MSALVLPQFCMRTSVHHNFRSSKSNISTMDMYTHIFSVQSCVTQWIHVHVPLSLLICFFHSWRYCRCGVHVFLSPLQSQRANAFLCCRCSFSFFMNLSFRNVHDDIIKFCVLPLPAYKRLKLEFVDRTKHRLWNLSGGKSFNFSPSYSIFCLFRLFRRVFRFPDLSIR